MHDQKENVTTLFLHSIPVDEISISNNQVRTYFEEKSIESLAHSIKEFGLLQPILVIKKFDILPDKNSNHDEITDEPPIQPYELIAGERRLRAAKRAGLKTIQARILNSGNHAFDEKMNLEVALRENIDRQNLHPIEEGDAYSILLDKGLYKTHEEISKAYGKAKSRITEYIMFSKFDNDVKHLLFKESLKERDVLRKCSKFSNKEDQIQFLKNIIQSKKENFKKDLSKTDRTDVSIKPQFKYAITDNQLRVSRFEWDKTKHNRKQLEDYANSLREFIKKLESTFLK